MRPGAPRLGAGEGLDERVQAVERAAPAGVGPAGGAAAPAVPGGLLWRRLRRHRLAVAGGLIVLAVGALAILAPALVAADPTAIDVDQILARPSRLHWFGTDDFGRDLLARVIYGTRLSLVVGVSVLVVTLLLGGFSGVLAGVTAAADAVIMRAMDALMAFPAILLALAVMAVAGPATANVVVALGIAYAPRMARLARASVLTVRSREYIEAARALGAPPWRIVRLHIVPNALAPLIVQGTFTFGYAILGEAALSFVGLGAVPPTPSLGNILADARPVMRDAPWMIILPSLTLSLTILGLNLFGDGLRDVLDPRMRL
ncbi:MAG: ABC transporter permease [Armatimonadota bacterium]|nr:ABC transporter permease [Armatimonadota bacterium]MDR7485246.1 ABC transporter permease [Armatimonadota bacterium]MDR7534206.1 ABC transporter permease [Armatimonadota bacterium]MDR7537121.1 ABC transporter permease [Armatimonadota bacterium]